MNALKLADSEEKQNDISTEEFLSPAHAMTRDGAISDDGHDHEEQYVYNQPQDGDETAVYGMHDFNSACNTEI
jgi:hypothetical protein